ncbi:hypothetical protein AUEXF2481DRAFT_8635 [Aureobasidium subglaciale EXF-2481]|uniref:Uncharacterized protein n=1 Tax=Aureobasidium subglaciale (strain EXF-2481) TaxID=1043005 RepID=A0A074Y0R4_AURSE|nr:uncharacterized protein AUEXF2481DRAFT_8635 [Aureobasidium subglaciale EXF-2481]KAI5206578.1 hypothetical protein E4T38_03727 [Aureobasidium subglaciale]KAI5224923.1 hypothetical protein E4T41_05475 [Aureobasidium subglaciale]KAI5225465.1 hypothetical protein E4T40_03502 [Aureobasidium subglaciale]KAI5261196.1 hypothetical protein E4T46_05368 [Aureobasidium subglaciale]KEQ91393.1 hypothetical protein AUEXF2481DRAFT_8635 [Aureobasidium subglaciale EXF-2481]
MDSLMHSCHKIMLERASTEDGEHHAQDISDHPPPAYSAEDSLTDSEDEDEDEDPSPITLVLNTDTKVQGTGNMIASPPLADATRLSALLLAAVQSLNAAKTSATQSDSPTPTLHVNLTINCGITVIGDRNIIGYKTQGNLPTTTKRKITEEESDDVPETKRTKSE